MSDTPRTDAETWEAGGFEVVAPSFARTLERELSAAIARAEAAEIVAKARMTMIGELVEENKKVTAELDRLTTLRPASEHDEKTVVQWFDMDEYKEWVPVLSSKYAPHTGCKWTPIPTPKEVKP